MVASAALALTSACAHPSGPGVRVQTVASDIVFGAKTAPVVPPPIADGTPPPAGAGTIPGDGGSNAADVPPTPAQPAQLIFTPKPIVRTAPAADPCPPAAEGAFPAQAATRDVPSRPKPGRYRWKVTVTRTVPGVAQPVVTTQFEAHDIVNVSQVTRVHDPSGQVGDQSSFTYDEVVHNPDHTTTTTTWKVLNNGVSQTATAYNNTGGFVGPDAGQPDRGVSIVRTIKRAADGTVTSSFAPANPVLVLELPATANASYQAEGTDPTNGSSLAENAKIVGHHRVDACGTVIDGWEADTSQAFTAAQGATPSAVTADYYVGTQIGGLITYISKQATGVANAPTIVESIGQLDPDPLP